MFRKFDGGKNRWAGVEPHVYKENPELFRGVTKQVLFDNEGDLPIQFRYFEVEPGGFTSLEHHAHAHLVVIFRGRGHALCGKTVREVAAGDMMTIPGWDWHQLRADEGELLGFFCVVNTDRDAPVYPTEEEMEEIRSHDEVRKFLGEH